MTSEVFGKLNLKAQREIVVLGAPASFESELGRLRGVTIHRALSGLGQVCFALAFVTRQAEVDSVSQSLVNVLEGDGIIWFAYPKGTSKRYKCDFNRDTGWAVLNAAGFESVRMVAIDEDWSALRFRRAQFVKAGVPVRATADNGVAKKKRRAG
jgi:hypothetical protein